MSVYTHTIEVTQTPQTLQKSDKQKKDVSSQKAEVKIEPTNQRVTSHRLGMCFVCHLCAGQDAVPLCWFVWVCVSSHPEMQCSTRGSSAFPYESVRQSLQWRHQAVHHTVHTAFGNTAINIMYTQDCLHVENSHFYSCCASIFYVFSSLDIIVI